MRSQPKLKAKNYYQNQLIELKPFSQIEEEFFANLEQAKISQIADFMSAAKSANAKEISPERLGQLSQKINQLAPTIHPRDEDALTELSSIINDFAALGYKKYQLQNLEIKKLTNVFNQKINPSSREISRFLRSCSDMHYNKDELAIDEEKLSAEINEKLNNFNLDEKISLLNALARFEYRDQPEIPPAFKKVARDVLKKITQSQNCGADQTARYVGSLTRLNFDSELLESVDGKLSLNQKIQNALSAKIDQLSSNYASYLLLAQIFYESRLNINLLGSDLLGKVAEKYQPETTEVATSKLQKLVAKSLPKGGVTQEYPLHEINEKSVRDIDIHFVVKKDGSSIEYFIEVDGPDHFSFADKNHPTTNKATTERDNLNKHLISKLPTLSECRYLTINYQEIEAHKQNLKDFLVKKLQESEVIDMQPDVSIKAAAEFGKEVKAKEKKPTETVIEAKTIPAQPIKKPSAVELTAPKTIKKNGKEKKSPLEDAIENGRAADVIAIIRSGEVNIEDTLPNGQTPFAFAIESGLKEDKLLEIPQVTNPNYLQIYNALASSGADLASYSPKLPQPQESKKKGRNKNKQNTLQEIFDISCNKEYAPLFCSLINHEAITLKDLKEDILVLAVRSGSPEIVEAVINKVGDLSNFKPKQAFGLALEKFQKQDSKESDKEILEKIILCSPDNSCTLNENKAEFFKTLLYNKMSQAFVKLFKESPSELTNQDLVNFLVPVLRLGLEDALSALLDKQPRLANIEILNPRITGSYFLPLNLSGAFRQPNLIKVLIDKGVDVNRKDSGEITPLIDAAILGYDDIIRALDKSEKLDLECINEKGYTALYCAASEGKEEAVSALIEMGANINHCTPEGITPLMMAAFGGFFRIVEALLQEENCVFDPQLDQDGNSKNSSALTVACYNATKPNPEEPSVNYYETVRLLLERGANPNLQNEKGHTAFDIAKHKDRTEGTKLIEIFTDHMNKKAQPKSSTQNIGTENLVSRSRSSSEDSNSVGIAPSCRIL